MGKLVGFRTIIVGLLLAILPTALSYIAAVDWTTLGLSPQVAFVISGAVMLAMRFFTDTPIAKPNSVLSVADMKQVAYVVTKDTPDGKELAQSIPGNSVITTSEAANLLRTDKPRKIA